jgi:hypothetical protein
MIHEWKFTFRLHLLNRGRVSAVHTKSEAIPKEIITEIHVRWTWWPGPSISEALRKWFDKIRLLNTSCRTSMATFTECGCIPFCWENVSICPTPRITEMASFCSCCRYLQFVAVLSKKIGPIGPCFLIAHNAAHFSGRCNVSTNLCEFIEAQKFVFSFFFFYEPIDVEMGFVT